MSIAIRPSEVHIAGTFRNVYVGAVKPGRSIRLGASPYRDEADPVEMPAGSLFNNLSWSYGDGAFEPPAGARKGGGTSWS